MCRASRSPFSQAHWQTSTRGDFSPFSVGLSNSPYSSSKKHELSSAYSEAGGAESGAWHSFPSSRRRQALWSQLLLQQPAEKVQTEVGSSPLQPGSSRFEKATQSAPAVTEFKTQKGFYRLSYF